MGKRRSGRKLKNFVPALVTACACVSVPALSVVAAAVASALMPVSVAYAGNGQCKWEGGPGAPTYPSCRSEDCIDNGGLAQCVAPVTSPLEPGPPIDADNFQYNVGDSLSLDERYECAAAGGVWNGFYGHPPCTADWDDYAGSDGAAASLADAFMNAKFGPQASLASDTGWIPTTQGYADGGTILVQAQRNRLYNYGGSSPWTVGLLKTRVASCPVGYAQRTNSGGTWDCYRAAEVSCPTCGNPVSPVYGEKLEDATDFDPKSVGGLEVRRFYRSMAYFRPPGTALGSINAHDVWRWSYQRVLYPVTGNASIGAVVQREDGVPIYFDPTGQEILNRDGAAERLVSTGSGWSLTRANGDVESYNTAGQLTSIRARAGTTIHLSYGPSAITITDDFGHSILYTLNSSGFIASATLPDGHQITYGYNTLNYLASVTYADGSIKSYVYEDPNAALLSGIIDENNSRFSTYTYGAGSGTVLTESHAGNVDNWSYQPNVGLSGGYSLITEPSGNRRQYNYTGANGVVKFSGQGQCAACGLPHSATYDANGNLSTSYDNNNNETTYVFDPTRNLETSRTEAAGTPRARTITTQWDATWRQPALITEASRTTAYTYDGNGNTLTKKITDTGVSPNVSRTWTYTYDSYGRLLTAKGPRTDVADLTVYTYYICTYGAECGQLQSVTDPKGNITTYNTYNQDGQPLTITDPNGVVTTLTYDLRQRALSRQLGSETTSFTYWQTGLLKLVTLPDTSSVLHTYDAAHRLIQISDAAGSRIVYTLDGAGHRTAEQSFDSSGALHRAHSWAYNAQNELYQDVSAAGTAAVTTTFGYDSNASQTSVTAPLSRITANVYDELNRLQKITDPNNGTTQLGYDAQGNVTSITDPRLLVTSYSYTGFGELKTQVSPDTGSTVNSYDSGGNLLTSTDARGAVATFGYDSTNRVTQIAYSLGGVIDQTIAFSYDVGANGKGRLTGASDANHSLGFTYDAQGRVASKSQIIGGITLNTGYAYTNGNLTGLTLPSGHVVTYGYNANHQVMNVMVNGTAIVNNITYEPFGAPNGWNWGNGTTTTRSYDADGRIALINNTSVTKSYSYDDGSRITGVTDAGSASFSWNYGYDQLDRLTSGSTPTQSQSFTYDANGNRLTQGGATSSTFTVASTSNRLSSIAGALTRTYTYDTSGHTSSYGGLTFTYNAAGRLISVASPSVTVQSEYNAIGQRIRKRANGNTTLFSYDEAGHLIGEYDGTGALVQEIVWLGDTPLATLRLEACGFSIFYIHTDHLNTPRRITRRSTQDVVWSWESDPFGDTPPNENPSGLGSFPFNLRFPGQYYDGEVGLHYNYFRDFDPSTGRYVESDPIGLSGGINTYSYVSGDPIEKSDDSGLIIVPPGFVETAVEVVSEILTGRPPRVPRNYACYARCPTIPTTCPEPNCPLVYGYGVGPDILTARNGSRNDANTKVPRGCQLKHCTYKCTGPKGEPIYPSR